jgi:3-deoxy-manno-octulosonate cytidylyltransferase (CMP-KDO synthetase)
VLYSIVPLSILGVIPARYASSRFPGKALVSIAGKTMLQHVWERASQARYLTSLVIATDDPRIRDAAQDFRARVVMTRPDHVSGTDRVAEAASASTAQIVVNIQGDEPMLDPAAIDAAVLGLLEHDEIPMGTLKKRIEDRAEIADPNVPIGPLEQAERLEQLRALENGFKIRVIETEYESLGVDTPEDWHRVSALYEKMVVTE